MRPPATGKKAAGGRPAATAPLDPTKTHLAREHKHNRPLLGCRFDPGGDSRFEFLCECGDICCCEPVALTLREYDLSSAGSVIGHPLIT